PGSLDVRDVVLLEQELDALRLAVGDLAAALDDAAEVRADVVRHDAARGGGLQLREQGGVGENRLRRDASPVAADSARPVTLDDGGAEPELGSTDRGHVAAGPGTHDDQVVLGHGLRGRALRGGARAAARGAPSARAGIAPRAPRR